MHSLSLYTQHGRQTLGGVFAACRLPSCLAFALSTVREDGLGARGRASSSTANRTTCMHPRAMVCRQGQNMRCRGAVLKIGLWLGG